MNAVQRAFDDLTAEFYEVWFRFHPTRALEAGVSGFEAQLPADDDDDLGALGSWLENTVVALEELDFQALDPARQLDAEILFGACQDEYRDLLDSGWRHRDPLGFLHFQAIHQLVLTPQVELRGGLEACLGRIPEYLRRARSQLSSFPESVPALWLEAACREGDAGIAYLRQVRDGQFVRQLSASPIEAEALCDSACEAVAAYQRFLRQEIAPKARGILGCGESRFLHRLHKRHGVRAEPERLLAFVRNEHQRIEGEIESLCAHQQGVDGPGEWFAALSKRSSMAKEEMLDYARSYSGNLRDFVLAKDLFTIPDTARLKLLPIPVCAKPGACSPTYLPPRAGDPALSGMLFVGTDDLSVNCRLPERLAGQCIRQGWVGSHLQAVSAAVSPCAGSLVRRLNPSSSLTQGWPLYVEQLLFEQGFSRTPEQALIRLLQQLRHALLAQLDIELHVNGCEPEVAIGRLEALPGVSTGQALDDFIDLSRQPTRYLAAVLGWRSIDALRMLHAQRPGFELKAFHERLLKQGAIAAPLLIRRVFGQDAWDAAEHGLGLAS